MVPFRPAYLAFLESYMYACCIIVAAIVAVGNPFFFCHVSFHIDVICGPPRSVVTKSGLKQTCVKGSYDVDACKYWCLSSGQELSYCTIQILLKYDLVGAAHHFQLHLSMLLIGLFLLA